MTAASFAPSSPDAHGHGGPASDSGSLLGRIFLVASHPVLGLAPFLVTAAGPDPDGVKSPRTSHRAP